MAVQQGSEVAQKGMLGGLGDFDEAALVKAAQEAAEAGETKGSATGEEIRDALGGMVPRLERIKVIAQAAQFRFEDGTQKGELVGVIAAHTFRNTLFLTPYEQREEGGRPDCYSNDGVNIADDVEEPQAKNCRVCTRNRAAPQGSDARQAAFDRDRDEACSNYLTLALALPRIEIPFEVRLTNRSFKHWATYIQRLGSRGRFLPHEVATRIRLELKHGAADYTEAHFEFVGPLPEEVSKAFAQQRDGYRQVLRRSATSESADERDDAAAAVQQAKKEAGQATEAGL